MSGKAAAKYFKVIDIIVLVFFLSTAVLGLYLFRRDLMQTLGARDAEPVGTIVIRQNVVQRRHEDRTIWDRLFVESPVYSGDLIRVAELSAASIFIEENQLNVNENTLIRIQQAANVKGSWEVELQEGNISLTSSEDSSGTLMLNLLGNLIQATGKTVLNAEVNDEGMSIQVNEGTAALIDFDEQGNEQTRELTEGSIIAKDKRGIERIISAAIVTQPKPNARFLKHGNNLTLVNFSWKRILLSDDDLLRMEISADRGFSENVLTIEGLDSVALAAFDTGVWFWRILLDTDDQKYRVLSKGELTVVDSSGPELLSPVAGTIYRYADNSNQRFTPQIRFQWAEKENASGYYLEVSQSPDFYDLKIDKRVSSTSSIQSGIGEGTWYWRVRPVYPSVYEGYGGYSRISSFIIVKTEGYVAESAAIEIPEPEVIKSLIAEFLAPVSSALSGVFSSGEAETEQGKTVPEAVPTLSRNRIQVPEPAPDPARTHTVKWGDTLVKIARVYYDDGKLYIRIVEANNIKNPDLIFPGQVFVIP